MKSKGKKLDCIHKQDFVLLLLLLLLGGLHKQSMTRKHIIQT